MDFKLRGSGGNTAGCEWIAAEGDITANSANDLKKYLQDLGGGSYEICINSDGGDLIGGMKLGNLIRDRGLHTAVGRTKPDGAGWWKQDVGICASAASLAFIGGNERLVVGGQLGVHQFYDWNAERTTRYDVSDISEMQYLNAKLIEYTVKMGVDPHFVSRGGSTNPEEMHFFDDEELVKYRIRWQPKEFEPWRLLPRREGLVARTDTRDGTEWAEILSIEPRYMTLRLCRDIFSDAEWMEGALPVMDGMEVYGHRISNEQLMYQAIDGYHVLDINLPVTVNLRTVASTTRTAVLNGDGPRYMWSAFCFALPTDEAATMMMLVLKNPIGSAE